LKTIKRNILVAPLNWGLGHATRCIPIIRELENYGYTPILASDGSALALLKKEFPHLQLLELPSYHIEYAKKATNLKWKILKNSLKTISALVTENRLVKKWVKEYALCGIISDNRIGVYNKNIHSVIVTHQLTVLSGRTTWISSKLHQFFIKNFKECWVPDFDEKINFSGKMGHLSKSNLNIHYIGTLSRFEKKEIPIKYDLMILLSGPEPQRTLLEKMLFLELKDCKNKVVFIKGIVENEQHKEHIGNLMVYNFMTSNELETTMNESEKILCRSGYTTIMDLIKLEKKAFFIPTPGQFEQEYLAKKLKKKGLLPSNQQDDFKMEQINEIEFYKGFPHIEEFIDWKKLFLLFECE
jgi:uncharacterized protein (TIGR00661 family)